MRIFRLTFLVAAAAFCLPLPAAFSQAVLPAVDVCITASTGALRVVQNQAECGSANYFYLLAPGGPAGPQGPAGATGPQGPVGAPGPQGSPGTTGAQGPAGPAGAKGVTGAQGVQGVPGAPGTAGAQGVQGAPGAQGPAGPAGPSGPAGAKGATGGAGPTGPAGAQGPAGATGPAGSAATIPTNLTAFSQVLGTGNTAFFQQGSSAGNTCTLGDITLTASVLYEANRTPADGRLLAIQGNQALFTLIGLNFGGNGTSNFALPDLRSAAPQNMIYVICTVGAFP